MDCIASHLSRKNSGEGGAPAPGRADQGTAS